MPGGESRSRAYRPWTPPTLRTAGSTTDGSGSACRSKLCREAVVDTREDQRAETKGDRGGDEGVDDVTEHRKLAEEERVADRLNHRRHEVAVGEEVDHPLLPLEPGKLVERVEDRRQEEPGKQDRRQEMLNIPKEHVCACDHDREAADERHERQGKRQRGPEGRPRLRDE